MWLDNLGGHLVSELLFSLTIKNGDFVAAIPDVPVHLRFGQRFKRRVDDIDDDELPGSLVEYLQLLLAEKCLHFFRIEHSLVVEVPDHVQHVTVLVQLLNRTQVFVVVSN